MKNSDIKIKVGIVVQNNDGKILLIKEKLKNKIPLWNIIKGTYDGDETILQTVSRECFEEAGIEVKITGFLGTYISEKSEKMRLQFNFIVTTNDNIKINKAKVDKIEDEEILESRWFTMEEVGKMSKEDFVSNRAHTLIKTFSGKKMLPIDIFDYVEM